MIAALAGLYASLGGAIGPLRAGLDSSGTNGSAAS